MGLDLDPKLKLNTLIVFLKELFEKVNLKTKVSIQQQKHEITHHAKS